MVLKLTFSALLALLLCHSLAAQNSLNIVIKDSENEALIGATALVIGTTNGASANENGFIQLTNIANGQQRIQFSMLGFEAEIDTFVFPLSSNDTIQIVLSENEEPEIIIEGTRSNRTIDNTPTRVEVLTEEIDEASTMDPSKIAHLITHSTGIQVQQTSATSNTANVRIQGLDGRYTQILKDGFPLYGGFSGSLSIMQIPPLDLRQIEYIKGGASTLYGGGAIAGLINVISKEPTPEETLIHLNASSIGAIDINTFISRRVEKFGFTLLAQRNTHRAFDADKDGFTDMPKLTKYNFNPKLFFYFNEKTKLNIGGTLTNEVREGGDMKLLNNEIATASHFYKEKNEISRITSQVKLDHKFNENHSIAVRNSFNIFDRNLFITPNFIDGEYRFGGKQISSFSEIAYNYKKNKNVLITGLNFYTDDFKEIPLETNVLRNESQQTVGAFANYTFDIGKKVSIESGLRADYVFNQKVHILPRVSALFKWTNKLTTRIGGGLGYRNASIFNQEAEILGYKNVLAINRSTTKAEESYGGNIDLGYKLPIGDKFFINFNQMFFYNYVDNPLKLVSNGSNFEFQNANGYTQSFGAETFFKFGFYNFVFFMGYTYTNATNHFNNTETVLTLTPRHSVKGDLLYALPGKWRVGLDYEFKSSQLLTSGRNTKAYWTYGVLVEYTHKNYTLFGNVENYTNIRQTKYESLLSTPNNTPQFTEVWAPLDGIVLNMGLKIRL
jgi:iron complex outermembrane receptor protein